MKLPEVAERFMRYVRIDTTSDPASNAVPSSDGQLALGRLLAGELVEMGADDVEQDEFGYVYASLRPGGVSSGPAVALIAHLDTSPDAPGAGVRPMIHAAYAGGEIDFGNGVTLDPLKCPELRKHIGHDIITSDGTTLLGSDDKAGVAIIMQLIADVTAGEKTYPEIRVCFTVDEEIGRGVDHLDLKRLDAPVAYTIDGSGNDVLYCETFNAAEATVRIRGRTVHPGYAYGEMVNALRIAGDLIAALPRDEAPETTRDRQGYFHPHRMDNSRTDYVDLKLLLRDFEADGLDRRKAFLRDLCESLRSRYRDGAIELEIVDRYRNMKEYIESVDPRARTFALAAAEAHGFQLDERPVRGGTDGARLSELGLPTPNIFNGGHHFHSVLEWNTVQNLQHSLAYLKTLMQYWAEHGS